MMRKPTAHTAPATRHRHRRLATLTLLWVGLAGAAVQPAPLPGPNAGVLRPTSTGTVQGLVLDARTQRPLADARVRVEEEGTFPAGGPSVARTDKAGAYAAR